MFYSSYSAILHLNYFLWEYSLLRNTGCSYGCSPIPNRRKYVLFTVRGFCFFGALLRSFFIFLPPYSLASIFTSAHSLLFALYLALFQSSALTLFSCFLSQPCADSSSFIDFLLIFVRSGFLTFFFFFPLCALSLEKYPRFSANSFSHSFVFLSLEVVVNIFN